LTNKAHALTRFHRFLRWAAPDISIPEPEFRFAAEYVGLGKGVRKRLAEQGLKDWRFDLAWPDYKIALEYEGGTFNRGRHTRPMGYSEDCRKYNAAQMLGWVVIRFTREMADKEMSEIVGLIVYLIEQKERQKTEE